MTHLKIITHMHIAIDGKINGPHLRTEESQKSQREYYNLFLGENAYYKKHKGWLCGKATSEANFTKDNRLDIDESVTFVPEGDFIADADVEMYYFSVDASGSLPWNQNTINYFDTTAHVVAVITNRASEAYKDMLRRKNISYIIAGDEQLDLKEAVSKIQQYFNMDELMVNGGGGINWSFMQADLVDEVSLVVTPIADGDSQSQSLFESNDKYNQPSPVAFEIEHNELLKDGSLWLRYKLKEKGSYRNGIA